MLTDFLLMISMTSTDPEILDQCRKMMLEQKRLAVSREELRKLHAKYAEQQRYIEQLQQAEIRRMLDGNDAKPQRK